MNYFFFSKKILRALDCDWCLPMCKIFSDLTSNSKISECTRRSNANANSPDRHMRATLSVQDVKDSWNELTKRQVPRHCSKMHCKLKRYGKSVCNRGFLWIDGFLSV